MSARRLVAAALAVASLGYAAPVSAGAWTTPPGKLWTKVAWFRLNSDRLFVDHVNRAGTYCAPLGRTLEAGDRAPYDCNLEDPGLRIDTLFLEAGLGLHDRVDLRVQVPIVLASEFISDGTPNVRRGLGDIRFGGQVGILDEPVVLAASLMVKAPTGFFTPDAVGVPLGEGQWDLTLRALASMSFAGGKGWAGLEAGYRGRLPNDELGFSGDGLDLGDDILAVLEGGGRPLPWLYLALRGELLYGLDSEDGFFTVAGRRVLYLQPSLALLPFESRSDMWKSFAIEWGVRIPLWGRNWPADTVYFLGVNQTFDLWEG